MKRIFQITFTGMLVAVLSAGLAAQEMSKDDWQKQMNEQTTKRNDLRGRLTALQTEVDNLKKQETERTDALKKCEDELLAMVGATPDAVAAFENQLNNMDSRLGDLSRLSNQDLWDRRAEVDSVQAWITSAKKNRLAALPKYYDRLSEYQSRLDALKNTLKQYSASGMGMMTYTVGTWARDRDCLWNIAKKPKVYDNAFLWPKIYQGNRDLIKDADVIEPGWKLKIPPKAPITKEEKAAERSYWQKKQSKMASKP